MGRPKSTIQLPQCALPGCSLPVSRRRSLYCGKSHSNAARGVSEIDRFERNAHGIGIEPSHVPGIGPCTLWTGTKTKDGYGAFGLAGWEKQVQAHIYAWELVNGPVPDRKCLCHKCDMRLCIRVDHLFIGTRRDNNLDRHQKGREAKGAANGMVLHPKLVPRGEAHGLAVLTDALVREIRQLHADGVSISELARRFGVVKGTIYQVVHRATWRHVTA